MDNKGFLYLFSLREKEATDFADDTNFLVIICEICVICGLILNSYGFLRNAPSHEVRNKIIERRIAILERQIMGFSREIEKAQERMRELEAKA